MWSKNRVSVLLFAVRITNAPAKYFGYIKCRARNVRELVVIIGFEWLPPVSVNPFSTGIIRFGAVPQSALGPPLG
jgi:hypothetical protein